MSDPVLILFAILCLVGIVSLFRRERRREAIRESFTGLALQRLLGPEAAQEDE